MKNSFRKWAMALSIFFASEDVPAQNGYLHDRVYTANQISNTVSVIDPSTQSLLGEIVLGKPQPDIYSPLYKGQALVHGMGYTPKKKLLAVVAIGSNSVTFISTENNKVLKTIYVGRSPHEATFSPDGKELWVSVRGEAYISVIDADRLEEVRRINVADGPGMVAFTPDGILAYVCSSFTPELDIVNVATGSIIKKVPVVSPFSPNIFCSPDGKWIAMTHKDVGKLTVINTASMSVEHVFNTGAISNHVTFTKLDDRLLMIVTVGGENKVRVFDVNNNFKQEDSVALGSLPHGVWTSADGNYAYVGLENDDSVQVVNLKKIRVEKTIPIGQSPQALVYATNATTSIDTKSTNLTPLDDKDKSKVIRLQPVGAVESKGTIVSRSIGLADLLLQSFEKLTPSGTYTLALTKSASEPYGTDYVINIFKADDKGKYVGQTTGIIQSLNGKSTEPFAHVILKNENNKTVLMADTK